MAQMLIKLSTLLKAKQLTDEYNAVKDALAGFGKTRSSKKANNSAYIQYDDFGNVCNGTSYNIYGYTKAQIATTGIMALPNEVLKRMLESYLEDIKKQMADLGVEIDQ